MTESKETFGAYLTRKRLEQGIPLRQMAEKLDISAPYLCDIEKDRRHAPDIETLDRIAGILGLADDERTFLYDIAGESHGTISPDLPEYIMKSKVVRYALRRARDSQAKEEAWLKFIEQMDAAENAG
jgi:transcriptional regulator with XRE-family HTH domain